MGYRKFGKSAGSAGSDSRRSARAGKARVGFLPEIQRGIYRFCHISGGIYAQYRETTKKLIGVGKFINDEFVSCSVKELYEGEDG